MRGKKYNKSRNLIWKRAGRSKNGDPGKKVYQMRVNEFSEAWGIEPAEWAVKSDEVLRRTAEMMGLHIRGSVRKYEGGSNGDSVSGYCLRDPVDPKRDGPGIPKIYQKGDFINVVVPPMLGDDYLRDLTGVRSYKRLV